MKKAKPIFIALIVTLLVVTQFAMVSAAPARTAENTISGQIESISVVTDEATTKTYVEIIVVDDGTGDSQTIRVSTETAYDMGLLEYDENDDLVPVAAEYWPNPFTISLKDALPGEEDSHHPVGNALAVYFEGIPGVDYDVIMSYHEDGYGFGVIAQALWLTKNMENGDADVLDAILLAKKTGNYSDFSVDGKPITNWGQLKKAIMDGDKKNNLGVAMKDKNKDNGSNGNGGSSGDPGNSGVNKDKNKDNGNNGSNGNNGNNGNSGNNGNGKTKP